MFCAMVPSCGRGRCSATPHCDSRNATRALWAKLHVGNGLCVCDADMTSESTKEWRPPTHQRKATFLVRQSSTSETIVASLGKCLSLDVPSRMDLGRTPLGVLGRYKWTPTGRTPLIFQAFFGVRTVANINVEVSARLDHNSPKTCEEHQKTTCATPCSYKLWLGPAALRLQVAHLHANLLLKTVEKDRNCQVGKNETVGPLQQLSRLSAS